MSVQISAYIQDDIKDKMEQYSSLHGVKKAFLVETAIEHYLQALHEIPNSIIVPSSMTVDSITIDKIDRLSTKEPGKKLKQLLS